ncbi:NUDIX hydrolase [Promicromonospora sukumoe]|uniref:NUDIX hydrolase n=1 Tax=Promicromonospora sukumoe TaxID=88382 RepID=UPI0037C5917F
MSAEPSNPRSATSPQGKSTQWEIFSERLIDDTRRAKVSIASVRLPDGVEFEQWVLRVPTAIMVLMLDDEDRILMMWRHRFIINSWVWELPGGYLDPDEIPHAAAFREVEEETGWRPREVLEYLRFQPMVGSVDQPNVVYLARGGHDTGAVPDINEAQEIRWIPLAEIPRLIESGQIVGAASVAGLMKVLLDRAEGRL